MGAILNDSFKDLIGKGFQFHFSSISSHKQHTGINNPIVENFHRLQIIFQGMTNQYRLWIHDFLQVLMQIWDAFINIFQSFFSNSAVLSVIICNRNIWLKKLIID